MEDHPGIVFRDRPTGRRARAAKCSSIAAMLSVGECCAAASVTATLCGLSHSGRPPRKLPPIPNLVFATAAGLRIRPVVGTRRGLDRLGVVV